MRRFRIGQVYYRSEGRFVFEVPDGSEHLRCGNVVFAKWREAPANLVVKRGRLCFIDAQLNYRNISVRIKGTDSKNDGSLGFNAGA